MVHSLKYDYYKFPGGGIEDGESMIDALVRETAEEAGLAVDVSSIKKLGYVHRVQRSDRDDADLFIQDNYYYICDAREERIPQSLDNYEAEEGFTLEFVDAARAIATNREKDHGPKDGNMLEREARVLEILSEEGFI
jgi:8-oxo-dGTP pyrophosphatase MutT (NUDIX family)